MRANVRLTTHPNLNMLLVSELGEKKSSVIEKALTVYFDFLDLKLVQKRLKDLSEGRDSVIDAKRVWEELGI